MINTSFRTVSKPLVHVPPGSSVIRGNFRKIRVIAVSDDETVPLSVRRALVGMEIWCECGTEEISAVSGNVPKGSRMARAETVFEELIRSAKSEVAQDLSRVCTWGLDMYVFQPGTFQDI